MLYLYAGIYSFFRQLGLGRFLGKLVLLPFLVLSVPLFVSFAAHAVDLETGVIHLKDAEQIPSEVYNSYPVNEIARAIVQRVRQQELDYGDSLPGDLHREVDLMNNADIMIFFWSDDLESILEKGLLNQHLSGKSRGTYSRQMRRDAEDNVTGIKLGEEPQALSLRPKSAFLNIHQEVRLAQKSHIISNQYGNIAAVLKTDVKERAFWTSADSLGVGRCAWDVREGESKTQKLLGARGTFYRHSIRCESACASYYESLIYGTLRVPDDVEYFLVDDLGLVEQLKPLGVPIYRRLRVAEFNRIIFKKGELFYEGEPRRTCEKSLGEAAQRSAS